MKGEYETQAFVARRDDTRRGFVWRCAQCGRYIGVIEGLDGSLEIVHKCGARNRLVGTLVGGVAHALPGDDGAKCAEPSEARPRALGQDHATKAKSVRSDEEGE